MSESSLNVVVIAGPNGSGKSTAVPMLLCGFWRVDEFVNADVIAYGLSAFHPESVALQAGRIMLNRLHELAGAGRSFAFETTLATRSFAPWLAGLQSRGYGVHILFLWLPSPEFAASRVAMRVRDGGHAIPVDVIQRRYDRGLNNFFGLYRHIALSWRIFDNSEPGRPHLIAARHADGRLHVAETSLWDGIRGRFE